MRKKAIDISRLYKACNSQNVLKGVNLRVNQGECFDLVRMYGASKTTLIKSSLEFCHVNSGNTRIFDAEHRLPDLSGYKEDCAA